MPNFELAIKVDGRLISNHEPSEHDKYPNQLLDKFPKLHIEKMTINEIYLYAEKFIQIHTLRCKKCRKDKACHKISLLINIGEIL